MIEVFENCPMVRVESSGREHYYMCSLHPDKLYGVDGTDCEKCFARPMIHKEEPYKKCSHVVVEEEDGQRYYRCDLHMGKIYGVNMADCEECAEWEKKSSGHGGANVMEESAFEWVSVEDEMPDSGKHVLVAVKMQSGGGYVCDAFYTAPMSRVCMYWEDIDSDYDEETDEYYYPEGWWEVIKNWDDYGCVKIEDTVTHWMPLPSVPWKSF